MWNRVAAWWLAVRWQRFERACAKWGMRPLPVNQADEVTGALNDLVTFTGKSGFLRDGRYPGGRLAERKIHKTVARVQGKLGTRKVP